MVALDPALGAAVVDQVGLEPEDRLDPVLATGLEVLNGAVHDAVVGEPERRHLELRRARRHRLDLACSVEQRVLAVHVQMGDAPAHRSIIASEPGGTDAGKSQTATILQANDLAAPTRRRRDVADDDASRPLTGQGGAPGAGRGRRHWRSSGSGIEACLTSPKVRAAATARLACDPLGIEVES